MLILQKDVHLMSSTPDKTPKQGFTARLRKKASDLYNVYVTNVWRSEKGGWKMNVAKTINLSVSTILNKDIQSTAYAMAFRTLLATVPALALLFAIGRGFGFSNILKTSLFNYFPAQKEAIDKSLHFVDSYLDQASEGIFVGIGLVFLLWTLISLLSSAETAFNQIWGVTHGRTLWRQISDYTAICLILPILMICSTGINIFMSSEIQTILPHNFLTPVLSTVLDSAGILMTWAFFTGLYKLLPNTYVKFSNAAIAGALAGLAFIILQFLFVSGQIYVSKYNAIYGSFAFLPLLMLWLQFVWLITLAGGVICYASQNIFRFNYSDQISDISLDYSCKILLAITSVIVNSYKDNSKTPTSLSLANEFGLPVVLVNKILDKLVHSGLIVRTAPESEQDNYGYVPAIPIETMTVGTVLRNVRRTGSSGFIYGFDKFFPGIDSVINILDDSLYKEADTFKITDLKINYKQPLKK